MLGRMPLVSMSDNRLGGIENSSLRYRSATRALEVSTSRMVRPSFSRRVRRLFPAGNIGTPPIEFANHIKGSGAKGKRKCEKNKTRWVCYEFRTRCARHIQQLPHQCVFDNAPEAYPISTCGFSVYVRIS